MAGSIDELCNAINKVNNKCLELEHKLKVLTREFIPTKYGSAMDPDDGRYMPVIPSWVFDYGDGPPGEDSNG